MQDPPGSGLQETEREDLTGSSNSKSLSVGKSQELIRDSVTITVIHYNIIL
jgi:hypothetical protein